MPARLQARAAGNAGNVPAIGDTGGMHVRSTSVAVLLSLVSALGPVRAPWLAAQAPAPVAPPVAAPVAPAAPAAVGRAADRAATEVHGRIENVGGLRILRVWGTPEERGHAHGTLLGKEIATVLREEFTARFGRRLPLLDVARKSLPRLIDWPDDVRAEIAAMFAAMVATGADLDVPALERKLDLDDLRIANALDVFGMMGCSGFTVWGDEVDGGGVLCGRNFDWPFTGRHMIDSVLLLVQHPDDGVATASVTWPGYVATVTGISAEGIAGFLHVGTGKVTFTPEPESWPIAVAVREILQRQRANAGAEAFGAAEKLLGYTSPPAGMLARIVLPAAPAGDVPVGVFECDSKKVERARIERCEIVTNHFLSRTDGRPASGDSKGREQSIKKDLDAWRTTGDERVSIDEAWQALVRVQRGGGHAFGTLHSVVFRAEPWHFELRLGEYGEQGLIAAPVADRRHVLAREQVFPAKIR